MENWLLLGVLAYCAFYFVVRPWISKRKQRKVATSIFLKIGKPHALDGARTVTNFKMPGLTVGELTRAINEFEENMRKVIKDNKC